MNLKSIIPVILIFSIPACQKKTTTSQDPVEALSNQVSISDAERMNASLETAVLAKQLIYTTLKVNGSIDVPPQNMVSISAPLGGYLKSSNLLPGMHVNRGESLATMEDPQYITIQQDYLTARAKLVFTEEEYHRQEALNQSKASSDKVFQQAKMDYIAQKVLVKSLSEKLKLIGLNPDLLTENNLSRSISIVSPIDGYVSAVNINIGKYANPSDIMFELVNPTDIHLALNIFEKDLDKLYIGQKLLAYTNNNPNKKYSCEIILIGKELSPDRSVEVHCHFQQYDKTLIPGMFMNAEIEVMGESAWVISSEAIVRFEGKQYVFAETKKNTFEMIEVTTANSENNNTQVFFPAKLNPEGKRFVTRGAYPLLMKIKNTQDDE